MTLAGFSFDLIQKPGIAALSTKNVGAVSKLHVESGERLYSAR